MKSASLDEFYSSSCGRRVAELLQDKAVRLWGDKNDERILLHVGYGLSHVDLSPMSYERVLSAVSDVSNLSYYDTGEGNVSCYADMFHLPFGDMSMDDVMVMHVLEFCHDIDALLSELRRILVIGGRLLLAIPLRSFWQLGGLLGKNFFDIVGRDYIFYVWGGFILLDCRRVMARGGGEVRIRGGRLVARYGTVY